MCSYISFRDGSEDDIPKPRTAEQIYEQAKKKNQYRMEAKHSSGTEWIFDYIR